MNFMLPKKRERARMGLKQSAVLRVPQFLKFVRQFSCTAAVGHPQAPCECEGPIEAAHVRTGTDGGTGMKPSDCYALPLCSKHHRRQHQIGEGPFEKEARVAMRKTADMLWAIWLKTDTGRRWALKTGYVAERDRNPAATAQPTNDTEAADDQGA